MEVGGDFLSLVHGHVWISVLQVIVHLVKLACRTEVFDRQKNTYELDF